MRRRALLRNLGMLSTISIAGCVSDSNPVDTATANTVLLDAQDAVPDKYDISIDVEVTNSEFTEDKPGIIRITTTNNGERVKLSAGSGKCSLFVKSRGGSDEPAGLWLHKPEIAERINRKEGRWVADKPSDAPRGSANYGCGMETYQAGQSKSEIFQVWDDYQIDGYLVPNTYRWETPVSISEETPETDGGEGSFSWGFSLTLKS